MGVDVDRSFVKGSGVFKIASRFVRRAKVIVGEPATRVVGDDVVKEGKIVLPSPGLNETKRSEDDDEGSGCGKIALASGAEKRRQR